VKKGSRSHGIYQLDDDTLTMCWVGAGKQRPKEFKGAPGVKLIVLKRVKP
jgi:hypothetical protein